MRGAHLLDRRVDSICLTRGQIQLINQGFGQGCRITLARLDADEVHTFLHLHGRAEILFHHDSPEYGIKISGHKKFRIESNDVRSSGFK